MHLVFNKNILSWNLDNKRILPWKYTENPYHIWLREVILQQTRVEQGAAYYQRFLEKYPQVNDLAKASLEEVYKDWEGLGYYSRARNLHFAAQQIMQDFGGVFPASYDDVIQLKGVGEYTAAAIMSFAYHQPYAVLDGNVFRVLSRFFGVQIPIDTSSGKKHFRELAQTCLADADPAVYNQAMMDFGATICTPQKPSCDNCPLSSHCIAYNQDLISVLPVKSQKIKRQKRFFNFMIFEKDDQIVIQQRRQDDIWRNLYQFPLIESSKKLLSINQLIKEAGLNISEINASKQYKQLLTHRKVYARFFHIKVNELKIKDDWLLIENQDMKQYSYPKIVREYLNERYNYLY